MEMEKYGALGPFTGTYGDPKPTASYLTQEFYELLELSPTRIMVLSNLPAVHGSGLGRHFESSTRAQAVQCTYRFGRHLLHFRYLCLVPTVRYLAHSLGGLGTGAANRYLVGT